MRLSLTKKESYIVFITFICLTAMLVTVYLFFLKPIEKTHESTESKLRKEEALLSAIEARLTNKQNEDTQGTLELQKRLPVDPLIEQFLLQLEKAETISGSFITAMDFGDEETEPVSNDVEVYMDEAQESNSGGEATNEVEEQTGQMPEGMERVTATLTVEAPSYFELEAFLQELEQSDRIMKVDELNFSGNKEMISTEDEPEKLIYTVKVTTFYYPKLEELKNQLPRIDIPTPSEKINPLVPAVPKAKIEQKSESRSDVNNQETETINKTEVEASSYSTHTVQQGETLFSISQKYFNDRYGETIIKQANNLTGNTVYTGQVLKIPFEEK